MIAEGKLLMNQSYEPMVHQHGVIRDTRNIFLAKACAALRANYPLWLDIDSGLPDFHGYEKREARFVTTETRGRIEVTQPDGALSTWTFTNWNQEDRNSTV